MSLTKKPVFPFSPTSRKVKKVYESVFPAHERLPYAFLLLNSLQKSAHFYAYYDQEDFVGFSYTIENADLLFVFFLAVNPAIQSRGYGGKILQEIKQAAGSRPIILTIEPVETEADNADQRQKRLAFYERQGFHLTSSFYQEGTETYQIMTSQLPAPISAFEKLMISTFWGLVKVNIIQG